MKTIKLLIFSLFILASVSQYSCSNNNNSSLPQGFVYMSSICPSIKTDVRYFGSNNFVGKPIDGYQSPKIICSSQAALALKAAQLELQEIGYSLIIYDAYRPQRAVHHFMRWAKDLNDTLTKAKYYPNVNKNKLFKLGYIAEKSSHSRGSTFDVSLMDSQGEVLDMGSPFDFFGTISWSNYQGISLQQNENRMLLQQIMIESGFIPYDEEWWHFTLKEEPFPDTYFDFVIK
ncbi:MAG: peptidase M15 [Bacteroidetes bacterium 4572_77]|nr:MAG: peptidase M15 [Bacteroidetes bacterium 4572_77]